MQYSNDDQILNIAVLGDVCLTNDNSTNYEKVLRDICPHIDRADMKIANMEYSINEYGNKIMKTGPNLGAGEKTVDFFRELGINLVTLANNHTFDYGEEGLLSAINAIKNRGILSIGAGRNIEEAYRSYSVEKGKIKLSIIAVCENEFGVATDNKCGTAGLDIFRLRKEIKRERGEGFCVLVIIHGGNEYNPLPSPGTVKRYREIIDYGATAVVGMHTHCPQGYEYYNDGLIVYSIGNFYFPLKEPIDQCNRWNVGYIADISFSDSGIGGFKLIPHLYDIRQGRIKALQSEDKKAFLEYIELLNEHISDMDKLVKYYKAWAIHKGKDYAGHLNKHGEFTLDRALEIQNLFRCEAHRELMQTYFELVSQGNMENYNEEWKSLSRLFIVPMFGN